MPKLSEEEYILKAASLYGLSDMEIDALKKDFSGEQPNEYIRKRCKALFDLYEIYKSKEYNDKIDTDENGLIIIDDYAYKISKRRLLDSKIGRGWLISSNLEDFLIVAPADLSNDINPNYINIAEKNNFLMPQLARQLGIDATIYYKGESNEIYDGKKTYFRLTKNFMKEDETLIQGDSFIKPKRKRLNALKTTVDLDKMIEETTRFVKKHYKKHKLPEAEAKEACRNIREGLIKQTIFNKLVFNTNEDNNQWGLIEDGSHHLRIAPIYNYNYCANVSSRINTCTRMVNKREDIEYIILRYSNEEWFKTWVEQDLLKLNLAQAEKDMERITGETLSDEEREYYNFVIMEKMHSKVVNVSDLEYDSEKVHEELSKKRGIRGFFNPEVRFFRRNYVPAPPTGNDENTVNTNDVESIDDDGQR